MDREIDGDGAINLSTSQRPSAATTPNDGIECDDSEQVTHTLLYMYSYVSYTTMTCDDVSANY